MRLTSGVMSDETSSPHPEDRRDRLCPHCGLGVLPQTKYCIRCGEPLPELPPTEEQVAADEKRRRWRAVIWFFDIFPGLLSGRVVAASLVAFIMAFVLGMAAAGLGAGLLGAGPAAIFLLPWRC